MWQWKFIQTATRNENQIAFCRDRKNKKRSLKLFLFQVKNDFFFFFHIYSFYFVWRISWPEQRQIFTWEKKKRCSIVRFLVDFVGEFSSWNICVRMRGIFQSHSNREKYSVFFFFLSVNEVTEIHMTASFSFGSVCAQLKLFIVSLHFSVR